MTSRKRPGARANADSIQKGLRQYVQQIQMPVAITRGADHSLVYANSAFCRLVGVATGAPIATMFSSVEGHALTAILDRTFRAGFVLLDGRIAATRQREGGWQFSVWPVFGDDDQVDSLCIEIRESRPIGSGSELQRQIAEQMLLGALRERSLADEAEAANRAKSGFLAAMSHELRTPLNAIGGYIDLMDMGLRGPVTEQQHADFARVKSSQRHLILLITEILNFTRIGTGSVTYAISDFNGCDALAHALALVEPLIAQRGLVFDGISGDPRIIARADPEKVAQILVNLLSNAIKFTPMGGHIGAHCAAVDEIVTLSISDTGPGIAATKVRVIFEPFVQLKEGLANRGDGVGLGLAISRDLARAMDGTLTVESVEGEGARFILSLPLASGD